MSPGSKSFDAKNGLVAHEEDVLDSRVHIGDSVNIIKVQKDDNKMID